MTMSMSEYYQARAQEFERVYDKPERQDDLRQGFVSADAARHHYGSEEES